MSVWKNLLAFISGQSYNNAFLFLSLLSMLPFVGGILLGGCTLPVTIKEPKPKAILQPSDGIRVQQENQQKILQLQQLLAGSETKQVIAKPKQSLNGLSLDMET